MVDQTLSSSRPGALFTASGLFLLRATLVVLVGLAVYVSIVAPQLAILYPIAILTAAGIVIVVCNPTLYLYSVVASFVFIARFAEGFQVTELAYGLFFISFLILWGVRFLTSTNTRLDLSGIILLGFFLCVFLSLLPTLVYQGSFRSAVSEAIALLFIGLFFPVSEACARKQSVVRNLLFILVLIGIFIVGRNLWIYAQAFSSAVYVYEIARGRVIMNEVLILASCVITLASICITPLGKYKRLLMWGIYSFLFAGLLVTQSRTYWLSFGLAAIVLGITLRGHERKRLVLATSSTVVALGGAAFLLVPDFVILIVSGLLERVLSIGSAASQDISMINRFNEASAVIERIVRNPFVGHGMGTTYRFYDITFELSREKAFVHNAYLALWFKFGIVGLLLGIVFLMRGVYHGYRSVRSSSTPIVQAGALSACAILASLLLSSLTTNPFYLTDTTFVIGICAGMANGCFRHKL